MSAGKVEHKYKQLGQAVERLGEALDEPDKNSVRIDAVIQRFEFTFELSWKVMKKIMERRGEEAVFPKDVLSRAHTAGWLAGTKEEWYNMLKDRNLSSHTYNEKLAQEIAQHIEQYYPTLKQTYDNLEKHLEE